MKRRGTSRTPFVAFLLLALSCHTSQSVPLPDFFPYGQENSDATLSPESEGLSFPLRLNSIRFGKSHYDKIYLSAHGTIYIGTGTNRALPPCGSNAGPVIAPFWAGVDHRHGGSIYYRESIKQTDLDRASEELSILQPDLANSEVQSVMVFTWDNVTFFGASEDEGCDGVSKRNTYQTVIISNNHRTFVINNYNAIEWTSSVIANGSPCTGLGGTSAMVGWSDGEAPFKEEGGSCTDAVLNIASATNVGVEGKFLFRVDDGHDYDTPCEGEERLIITPHHVSPLGGQLIKITGICLQNVLELLCSVKNAPPVFGEIARDRNSATCLLPQLNDGGMVAFSVSVKRPEQEQTTYTALIYLLPYLSEGLNVTTDPLALIHAKWDPTVFGDTDIPLQFGLMTVSDVHIPYFNQEIILKRNIFNLGFFDGLPDDIDEFKSISNPLFYFLRMESSAQPDVYIRSKIVTPIQSNETYHEECARWAIVDEGVTMSDEIKRCPITVEKARACGFFVEERLADQVAGFYPAGEYHLFVQRVPSREGHGQHCVYRNGEFFGGMPLAGGVQQASPYGSEGYIAHYMADIYPWLVCCGLSRGNCGLYYEKRPLDVTSTDDKCDLGDGWADPHFNTLDRFRYDFMGHGEFWLVWNRDSAHPFRMQSRQEPYVRNPQASTHTAFVLQENNVMLQVDLIKDTGIRVRINGEDMPTNEDNYEISLENTATITVRLKDPSKAVVATFASGFSVTIKYSLDTHWLDHFIFSEPKNQLADYRGLMGRYDGNVSNDLTSRINEVLPLNSTRERIHNVFGMTWVVEEHESLFVYDEGKSWADYYHPEYAPVLILPDIETFPAEVQEVCGTSLACYYDYHITGDLEFARQSKQHEDHFDDIKFEIEKPIPVCPTIDPIGNGTVNLNSFFIGGGVVYNCNDGFWIVGETNRTCQEVDDGEGNVHGEWDGTEPFCRAACVPTCSGTGQYFIAHPRRCNEYYLCFFGEMYVQECPDGLIFNPEEEICDFPQTCACLNPPGCRTACVP